MTAVEKKKALIKAIDSLSEEQLNDALLLIKNLKNKDTKRLKYAEELLNQEESLFKRLAE